MIIAIILSCKVFTTQFSRSIVIFILLLVLITLILLAIKLKNNFTKILIPIVIALIIPFVSIIIKSNKINQNHRLNVEKCEIYGKIYKINEKLDNNRVDLYLTNVELKSGEEKIDFYGNYLLRVSSDNLDVSKLENGYYIQCSAKTNLYSLNSSDKFDLSYISRDIMGMSYTYSYAVHVCERFEPSLRDSVTSKVYSYFEKTDLFFTGVGYAMLFGDTTVIEESVYGVFELSGTLHLLSVSGFHVSVIAMFIAFILRKLKANKLISFLATALVMIFYSYLCNFSVSIVRAVIMSLIAMYAGLRNKECDRLSSLFIAAIFIMLLNPLDLFNISFILSFVSVLSILLLMPVFERFFSKFMHEKLAGALSLSLSISFGITIYELYYFGQAPILSFVSNIITVPIVSALFIFLIISLLVGSLFGIAVPLIEVFGFGIKYILQFNNWVAGIGLNILVQHVREITLVLTILLMYSISDYLFVKKKSKAIIAGLFTGIILSVLFF